jgi:thioredoxin reductase
MLFDAVIAGGGPAGLAGALTLGRGRKRVLLCDAGTPRNAAAVHVHNFVTRDGVTPAEFRRLAREQLEAYPNVEVRDEHVEAIEGERGAFAVRLAKGEVRARRVLLCTGMIDEMPDVEGFAALWGKSIFQCPYCHAWEVQDRRFAYLAMSPDMLEFALLLRGWTDDVAALTNAKFTVPAEMLPRLKSAGIRPDERRIRRLVGTHDGLARVEFADGDSIPRDILFVHPHQRQVPLVRSLGVALDAAGFVQVDEASRETSIPGIYAAGDLVSHAQSAVLGAASGMRAAAMLNFALTADLAASGGLS